MVKINCNKYNGDFLIECLNDVHSRNVKTHDKWRRETKIKTSETNGHQKGLIGNRCDLQGSGQRRKREDLLFLNSS